MSEKVKQRIAMMINNTARIILFGVLAILFNKWWIVLVSALFLMYEKDEADSEGTNEVTIELSKKEI